MVTGSAALWRRLAQEHRDVIDSFRLSAEKEAAHRAEAAFCEAYAERIERGEAEGLREREQKAGGGGNAERRRGAARARERVRGSEDVWTDAAGVAV